MRSLVVLRISAIALACATPALGQPATSGLKSPFELKRLIEGGGDRPLVVERIALPPISNVLLLKINRAEFFGERGTCRLGAVVQKVIDGPDYRVGDPVTLDVTCEVRKTLDREPNRVQREPIFDAAEILTSQSACARIDARGKIDWGQSTKDGPCGPFFGFEPRRG